MSKDEILYESGEETRHDVHVSSNRNTREKEDRAVAEQVMDARTRMILFKMINTGLIEAVHGCISTGKEANVYYAQGGDSISSILKETDLPVPEESLKHLAIKIYKSTILTFKRREQYVTGEYRFRQGYCKSNPRKMVRVWAEKEFRNLRRLVAASIPAPVPLLLRSHVLLMTFLSSSTDEENRDSDWQPAPRLKDALIESPEMSYNLYLQCVKILRSLYRYCKLVHADFSEYNLLVRDGEVYVIDVSQSVEHEHPEALTFLRHDCSNVLAFFRSICKTPLPSLRALFEFVCAKTEGDSGKWSDDDQVDLVNLHANIVRTEQDIQEEAVFMKAFIPRTLEEIGDSKAEHHIALMKKGNMLNGDLSIEMTTRLTEMALADSESEEEIDSESESFDTDSDYDESLSSETEQENMEDLKTIKKEHKKAVKEANRVRREGKLKKHIKKRLIKMASHK